MAPDRAGAVLAGLVVVGEQGRIPVADRDRPDGHQFLTAGRDGAS